MTVKLIDLQLIYGLGAREKFEDLAFDLIKGEESRAQKVRSSQGDGGIDAHVNDLSAPGGVHVYQCKFFPKGLEDTQKGQIRESFKRCRKSTDYKLNRWTLCLPLDLSVPERQWFESWRDSQKSSGVVIDDPWGASILENLLHQDKNKGLRDAYFKEEFIAQIGDMHGIVHRRSTRTDSEHDPLAKLKASSRAFSRILPRLFGHRGKRTRLGKPYDDGERRLATAGVASASVTEILADGWPTLAPGRNGAGDWPRMPATRQGPGGGALGRNGRRI